MRLSVLAGSHGIEHPVSGRKLTVTQTPSGVLTLETAPSTRDAGLPRLPGDSLLISLASVTIFQETL